MMNWNVGVLSVTSKSSSFILPQCCDDSHEWPWQCACNFFTLCAQEPALAVQRRQEHRELSITV